MVSAPSPRVDRQAAGAPVPPPVFVMAMITAGWGLQRIWPMRLPTGVLAAAIAAGASLAAAALLVGALLGMRRARTPIEPWAPTTALVTSGVFGFSRNPVYVGFLCVQLAVAWGTGNGWMLALVLPAWLLLDVVQVRREERYLLTKFGDPYAAYQRRVRRWL